MKRIILLFIRCALFIPYWLIKSLIYVHSKTCTTEKKYSYAKKIANSILKRSRVTLHVSGQENIPEKNGYVIYPNHQGLFDTFAFFHTMNEPFTVIIKKEMRNLPLLGTMLDLIDATALDRDDIRQNMKVITKMIKEVKEGRNYIIFAEGTRSKNGNNIQAFKPGSFKAATKAKAPIVPVALIDSFKPFDINTIKKVSVQAHYLKPLYYEDYKDMNTTEIAHIVENMIRDYIKLNTNI